MLDIITYAGFGFGAIGTAVFIACREVFRLRRKLNAANYDVCQSIKAEKYWHDRFVGEAERRGNAQDELRTLKNLPRDQRGRFVAKAK